ncbi:MAG: hypothetical protein ACRER4_01850 [Steroidobacteraceae bacterium]
MATVPCPSCGGRAVISNAKTGSPELCPNCQGQGKGSLGLDDLPFWYPIAVTLTSGQSGNIQSVTIDNDSDFEWRWIIFTSILANGAAGLFSVTLLDKFTSRPLSPSAINGENIGGTAQLPFTLPKPYLLRRTSTIQGTFNDRSIAGVNNIVQFCLVGYKLAS